MNGSRWTRRRNGSVMTTLEVKAHIPLSLVEWMKEQTGWPERKVLNWVRLHLQRKVDSAADWSTPAIVDGEPNWIDVDDIGGVVREGGKVYPGDVREAHLVNAELAEVVEEGPK